MSEKSIIGGFGKEGKWPDWATEKTLRSIEKALGSNDKDFDNIVKLLAKIARGEQISQGHYKSIMDDMRRQRKASEERNRKEKERDRENEDNNRNDRDFQRRSISDFGVLKDYLKHQIGLKKEELVGTKRFNKRVEELLKEGVAQDKAESIASAEGAGNTLSLMKGMAAQALGFVMGTAAVGSAANESIMGQLGDRFNFANEMRQSGLLAGLTEAQASLGSFSEAVGKAGMTLGEAAEFTTQYNEAAGDLGVVRALGLVNDMAYGMNGAVNMMQEFGMSFGQTATMTGEYLDTLKNLGVLDTMKNEEIRAGMDNFMTAVSDTSNVLKISMEESAKLIKESLTEERTQASLGMLAARGVDQGQIQALRDAISTSSVFGQNSQMGNLLTRRLVSGGRSQFLATQEGQSLLDNPATMRVLNEIERIAASFETGGAAGLRDAIEDMDVQGLLAGMSESERLLIERGEGGIAASVISELMQLSGRLDDIGKEMPGPAAGDYEMARYMDTERRMSLAVEKALSAAIAKTDFAESMRKRNDAMFEAIDKSSAALENIATRLADDVIGTLNVTVEKLATAAGLMADFANSATTATANMLGAADNPDGMDMAGQEALMAPVGNASDLVDSTRKALLNADAGWWSNSDVLSTTNLATRQLGAGTGVLSLDGPKMQEFVTALEQVRKEENMSQQKYSELLKELSDNFKDYAERSPNENKSKDVGIIVTKLEALVDALDRGM